MQHTQRKYEKLKQIAPQILVNLLLFSILPALKSFSSRGNELSFCNLKCSFQQKTILTMSKQLSSFSKDRKTQKKRQNEKANSKMSEFEKRKGAKKKALLQISDSSMTFWKHKDLGTNMDTDTSKPVSETPVLKGGRGRSERRQIFYQALSAYKSHFMLLIQEELKEEKAGILDRLKTWPNEKLSREGFALFGLSAQSKGRLFKDQVFRFSVPFKGRNTELPWNIFSAGDFITVTDEKSSPIDDMAEVAEAVILESTPLHIDVCMQKPPKFLLDATAKPQQQSSLNAKNNAEADKQKASSKKRFRLDLFFNSISYERMTEATDVFSDPESAVLNPGIKQLLLNSLTKCIERLQSGDDSLRRGIINPAKIMQGETETEFSALAGQKLIKNPLYNAAVTKAVKELADSGEINSSQGKAIQSALTRTVTLIQGPPGTGKTRTACTLLKIATQLQKQNLSLGPREKILAAAFSNVAADNLLDGLLKQGVKAIRIGRVVNVRRDLWHATLDYILETDPRLITLKSKVKLANEDTRNRKMETQRYSEKGKFQKSALKTAYEMMQEAENAAVRKIFGDAEVVVCSCIGSAHESIVLVNSFGVDLPPPTTFPFVLIDEAAQSTEPASLVPILRGCQQLVLVGDQNQLPPTVISEKAEQGGLGLSLFSRLVEAGIRPLLLNRQYRMHPQIAAFSSAQFYQNNLISNPRPEDRPLPLGFQWPRVDIPVCFVQVSGNNETFFEIRTDKDFSASIKNEQEAKCIVEVLKTLIQDGDIGFRDIGIITPYSAQVKHLTDVTQEVFKKIIIDGLTEDQNIHANKKRSSESDETLVGTSQLLEIKSVDGYQGREKELIIISAVRSNAEGRVGFLSDWRRLNVAATRAKRGLIIFGDSRTLKNDFHWKAYIDWCQKHTVVLNYLLLNKNNPVTDTE